MSNPIDTNQASELFELCKEVYERTEWKPTDWQHGDEGGQPIYTSDYLLEKLPKTIWSTYGLAIFPGDYVATAGYYDPDGLIGVEVNELQKADTPLKALLKLTIALSEAGELK